VEQYGSGHARDAYAAGIPKLAGKLLGLYAHREKVTASGTRRHDVYLRTNHPLSQIVFYLFIFLCSRLNASFNVFYSCKRLSQRARIQDKQLQPSLLFDMQEMDLQLR
jgi:hypothetical protein